MLASFFYPSIIWPGGRIDYDAAYRMTIPPETPVGGQDVSASGLQETLIERVEVTVSIVFQPLTAALLTATRNYWRSWGLYGRPGQLILDRNFGCAGQYEYDNYNTYFSRAILITNPFTASRMSGAESRGTTALQLQLAFRQDGG
jgi:hypothetical protein